ncbi:MAG: DUF3352 domain-containing protein [Leptolyngbyaceae cyanobacterium MO_188.B28]|nr:DUF3352 domain-containing protein [Leptolyngbyaceae cyanobacterium MO_188.B28]
MKFRTFVSTLLAVVFVLLTLGIGGFWKLTAQTPLSLLKGGGQAAPSAAIFVPKQAPVMVSLLVNPDRLAFLRRVLVWPGARRRARAEIDQIERVLLAKTGLTYSEDIQPWLGEEVTFAVTAPDIDRDLSNGEQPGYLLVLTSKDGVRAKDFIQLFWQKRAMAGADLVFEQYSGVKLIYGGRQQPSVGARNDRSDNLGGDAFSVDRLASAVVGDRFILFANEPAVLRQAVNAVQVADLNLDSSRSYQRALETLSVNPLGVVFINFPQLTAWLGDAAGGANAAALSPDESAGFEHALFGLTVNRRGLLADTALVTAAGEAQQPIRPVFSAPVEALQHMPKEAALAAAGSDLSQTWQSLLQGARSYPAMAAWLRQIENGIQAKWGLSPSESIFPVLTGEYALGMVPYPDPASPDWIFVVQRDGNVDAAIESLDALAQDQGLSVTPLTLSGREVSAWTTIATAQSATDKMRLQTKVEGLYTQIGDYELFATSVAAMDLALKIQDNSLLDSARFQQAIAPLSPNNDGVLYLDWPIVKALVEEKAPLVKFLELGGQPFFNHLDSLAISSYGGDVSRREGGIFLRLADR